MAKVRLLLRQSKVARILLYPFIRLRRLFLAEKREIENNIFANIERLFHSDPVLRLPEFKGRFCIGVESDLFRRLVKDGDYEASLVDVCEKYLIRDRDVLDIGANIGFYTVLLGKLINDNRKVLSVEPTPNALKRLYKNIVENELTKKVELYEGVVSDVVGDIEINTIEGREEYSSIGAMAHPSVSNEVVTKIKVESSTVDRLVEIRKLAPGFIKIDVEGAEYAVLKGMKEVILKNKPIILSELSNPLLKENGTSSQEVISFIEDFGYKIIDPKYPNMKPGDREYGDILCVPIVDKNDSKYS